MRRQLNVDSDGEESNKPKDADLQENINPKGKKGPEILERKSSALNVVSGAAIPPKSEHLKRLQRS